MPQEIDSNGQTNPVNSAQQARTRKLHHAVFQHYDNLFRIIYNEHIDYGKSLQKTLSTCMGIVAVGDDVGALNAVSRELEKVLLQCDKRLWAAIAYRPAYWANFAAKIQSAVIFKDAMVHLVGKWALLEDEERARLTEPIKKVCRAKVLDFQRQKQALEVRMLGYYSLSLRKNDQQDNIKRGATGNPARSVYANDIYGWMALGFFRQWFSQVICEGNNFRAKDGGYRFYKALNEGGGSYLTEADQDGFYHYFPMSDKAKGVMDNHLLFFKEDMKEFAAPLFENNTHYSKPEELQYLVSAKVEDEDCPWMAPAAVLEGSVELDDDDPDFQGNPSMPNPSLGYNTGSHFTPQGFRLPVRSLEPVTPRDGSAERGHDALLVQTQLINAANGVNMNDDDYDRRVSDITNQSAPLFVSGGEPIEQVSLANDTSCAQSDLPALSNDQSPINDSNTIIRPLQEEHGPAPSSNEPPSLSIGLSSERHEENEEVGMSRTDGSNVIEQIVERSLSKSPETDNVPLPSDENSGEAVKIASGAVDNLLQ